MTLSRHTFPVIAAFAIILTGCSGSAPEGTRHPLYIKGIKLEKAEQYERAAAVFERCLRQDPDNRPAHVHLGMLYEDHLNDPVTALYHYRQGAADGAEDAHAQFARHAAETVLEGLVARHLENTPADTAESTPEDGDAGVEELKARVGELTRQRDFLASQLKTAVARLQAVETELKTSRAIQTAPRPEADKPAAAVATSYQVKRGDTLSGIAREHYGSSTYWRALRDYNRDELRGGDQVIPGMTLRIPPRDTLEKN
ncbi:MAG: LysM peptidoglycan-binding domain-containing protein [Lentisphaeria bacterium]|nr:LysM peptidoglycan-binding domain-containing protein [Lentisphaeria bacterium]